MQKPLAEALALLYIFPIVAVALSLIFLQERISILQFILIVIGFVGVLLVLNPSATMTFAPRMFAIMAGILMGVYIFLTKVISKGASPLASNLYSGMIGIVIIPLFPGFEYTLFSSLNLFLSIIMGVLAALGHYCLFISMRVAPVSVVSPFSFAEIIFASIVSVWWFNDALSGLKIWVILMILFCGIWFNIISGQNTQHKRIA